MWKAILAALAALVLVGCGGSGSDNQVRLRWFEESVVLTSFRAGLPLQTSVGNRISGVKTGITVYVDASVTGTAFEPIGDIVIVEEGFIVDLTTFSDLDYGTYTGTITGRVCRDPACANVLGSDVIPYSVTIVPPSVVISSAPLEGAAITGGIVRVPVTTFGVGNAESLYGRVVTDSGAVFSTSTFELYRETVAAFEARVPVLPTVTGTAHAGDFTLEVCGDPACVDVFDTQALSYALQVIEVWAGQVGTAGGTDGPVADARFDTIRDIALDGNGNLFVGEMSGATGRLRLVTPAGVVSTLETFTSTGLPTPYPHVLTVDSANTVYFGSNLGVYRRTAGGVVELVSNDNASSGLFVDASGNLWAAKFSDFVQRAPDGTLLRTVDLGSLLDIHVDVAGTAYLARTIGITAVDPGDTQVEVVADLRAHRLVPEGADALLFIGSDPFAEAHGLYRVTLTGELSELLPQDVLLADGNEFAPFGLARGADGTIYLSGHNAIFRTTLPLP